MVSTPSEHLDWNSLISEGKRLGPAPELPTLKIALCGDVSLQPFVPVLNALLRRAGYNGAVYEAPFAATELQTYDPESALYRFKPDFVVVLNSIQTLSLEYYGRKGTAAELAAVAMDRMEHVWKAIRSHCAAIVIQSNFVLPKERLFGNFDQKVPESLYSTAALLNRRLAERACQYDDVLINDVEAIASFVGRRTWFDERFWFMAKTFCALEHLPLVARNIVQIATARQGRIVKCVVLDLDNTLWGGVIGDDGVDGISLSAHGAGEEFYTLQCFLRELSRRGILLAVCSKNNFDVATGPFLRHPDMVLKLEDIALFVANWEDKAHNIRHIRNVLNIGFDSMVFLDDNPFERALVRELLPDVIVPELPSDPSEYLAAISALNLFEAASFSDEDRARTQMYRAESQSRAERESYTSLEDFLASLHMRITVARWDNFHLPRIAQLLQRSNQFNLITQRRSERECASLMRDPDWLPLYATLTDRLTDHGLISLVTCSVQGQITEIHDWVMSCRVLARGVEQYLMARVLDHAASRGCRTVRGRFIPTAKNAMVRDFFARFGFSRISEEANGATTWELDVDRFEASPTYILPASLAVTAAH